MCYQLKMFFALHFRKDKRKKKMFWVVMSYGNFLLKLLIHQLVSRSYSTFLIWDSLFGTIISSTCKWVMLFKWSNWGALISSDPCCFPFTATASSTHSFCTIQHLEKQLAEWIHTITRLALNPSPICPLDDQFFLKAPFTLSFFSHPLHYHLESMGP